MPVTTSEPLQIAVQTPPRVPGGAQRLASLAERHGFAVLVGFTAAGVLCIEGHHAERRVGFRAYWRDGSAAGATWHEPRSSYREVAAPAEALQGAGNARGMRATGYVDGVRLVRDASPAGVWVGVSEVTRRLESVK